jgi:arsenate reductase
MVFICYPKCSTCKKAQAWLKAQGLDCEVRDIQKDNPTLEELRQSGLPELRDIPLDTDPDEDDTL